MKNLITKIFKIVVKFCPVFIEGENIEIGGRSYVSKLSISCWASLVTHGSCKSEVLELKNEDRRL